MHYNLAWFLCSQEAVDLNNKGAPGHSQDAINPEIEEIPSHLQEGFSFWIAFH